MTNVKQFLALYFCQKCYFRYVTHEFLLTLMEWSKIEIWGLFSISNLYVPT